MADLQVELLDTPAVIRDGRRLGAGDLGSRRVVLCLAVLAVQAGRSVSREVLADALWEEARPPSWRANLRTVVSRLRRVLGDVVVSTSDGYRLDVPRTAVDVLVLERHAVEAAQAGPAEAWALAAHVLPPPGAVALRGFDGAWSDRLRAQVAETGRHLRSAAAEAALDLGRTADAERLTRELVAGQPLREDGYRLAMRAHAAAGNRAEALAAYDTCRRLLEEHLGARPSPETEAVFLDLLRGGPLPAGGRAGGERPRPVEYLRSSAQLALDAGIFEDCVRAAAAGLAALDLVDHDPPGRAALEVLLGAAQHQLGDPAGAVLLQRVIEDARARGDAGTLADAALGFTASESASSEVAVDEQLLDLYREALAGLDPDDGVRRARLLSRIACGLSWRTDYATARGLVAEAVALADAVGDPAVVRSTLCTARRMLTGSGELSAQADVEARLEEVAGSMDDATGRAKAAAWMFATAVERGEGDRLESLLDQADRHAADVRAGAVLHFLAYTRAALTLLRGDLPEAAIRIEEAASLGRRTGLGPHVVEALRLVQLVPYWQATGRLAAHRDEVVAAFSALAVRELSSMVAIAEAAAGDHGAAHANLTTFLDHYCSNGPSLLASAALAVQVTDAIAVVGDADHARRLYPLLAPLAGQGAYIAHFVGPVDLGLGLLSRTMGDHAAADRHLRAAERFAVRLGAPVHAARCRDLLAGRAPADPVPFRG